MFWLLSIPIDCSNGPEFEFVFINPTKRSFYHERLGKGYEGFNQIRNHMILEYDQITEFIIE